LLAIEKEAEKQHCQGLANAAKNFKGTELQPDTLGLLVKGLNVEGNKKRPRIFIRTEPRPDELFRAGLVSKQEGSSTSRVIPSQLGQTSHRSMSASTIMEKLILTFDPTLKRCLVQTSFLSYEYLP
jgi:hypothetical protein